MSQNGPSDAPQPVDAPLARGETSDDVLLRRVAGGDVDALTELYDRYRALANAIALRITGSVPAAEDVLQDAFIGAWRNAARYDSARGSVRSWLCSIVHHRAVDVVRRRRAIVGLPDAEDPPPAGMLAPDVWPEVAGRLDAAAVRVALQHLPDVQREAIELAYWGGLTQSEIAARTATPIGTVKSRVRLGLLTLRRELTPSGGGTNGDPSTAGREAERPAHQGEALDSRDQGRLVAVVHSIAGLWCLVRAGPRRRASRQLRSPGRGATG